MRIPDEPVKPKTAPETLFANENRQTWFWPKPGGSVHVISVFEVDTAQFVAVYCQKLAVPYVMFIVVVEAAERPSTANLLDVKPRFVPEKITLAPPTVRAKIELPPRVAKYGLVETMFMPRSDVTDAASTLTEVMETSFTSVIWI